MRLEEKDREVQEIVGAEMRHGLPKAMREEEYHVQIKSIKSVGKKYR